MASYSDLKFKPTPYLPVDHTHTYPHKRAQPWHYDLHYSDIFHRYNYDIRNFPMHTLRPHHHYYKQKQLEQDLYRSSTPSAHYLTNHKSVSFPLVILFLALFVWYSIVRKR